MVDSLLQFKGMEEQEEEEGEINESTTFNESVEFRVSYSHSSKADFVFRAIWTPLSARMCIRSHSRTLPMFCAPNQTSTFSTERPALGQVGFRGAASLFARRRTTVSNQSVQQQAHRFYRFQTTSTSSLRVCSSAFSCT
jgi:hypothetical protein